MTLLLALVFPLAAHAAGADGLTLEWRHSGRKIAVRFVGDELAVSSPDLTFRTTTDSACARAMMKTTRIAIARDLASRARPSEIGRGPVLTVQGVTSAGPRGRRFARAMDDLPFTLFTLAQSIDRECPSTRRRPASADVRESLAKLNRPARSKRTDCALCAALRDVDYRDDARTCVESLCPNDDLSLERLTNQALASRPLDDPMFKREVEPLVEAVRDREEKLERRDAALIDRIERGRPLDQPLEAEIAAVMGRIFATPAAALRPTDDGTLEVEPERLRELGWPDARVTETVAAFETYATTTRDNPVDAENLDRFIEINGEPETKRLIAVNLERLKSLYSAFTPAERRSLGARGVEIEADLVRLPAAVEAGRFPKDVFATLNYDFTNVLFTRAMIDRPPANVGAISSAQAFRRMRADFAKNFAPLDTAPTFKTADARARCAATYSLAKEFGVPKAMVDRLKPLERPFIDTFLARTRSLLSEPSARHVSADAKAWHFRYAPTFETSLDRLKNALVDRRAALDASLSYGSEKFSATDVVTLAVATKKESSLTDLCTDARALVRDGAYKDQRAIYISPAVAHLWPKANSIANHELGHLLDYATEGEGLSAETRRRKGIVRGCLRDAHGGAVVNEAAEDFADFAGALADDDGVQPTMCIDMRDWLHRGAFKAADFSLTNGDTTDTHASDLFRVLQHSVTRTGAIPPSCRSALEAKGEKFSPVQCQKATR